MIWVSRSPQVLPVGSLTDPREPLTSASRQEGGRGPDKLQAGYGWAPEKGLRRARKTPSYTLNPCPSFLRLATSSLPSKADA